MLVDEREPGEARARDGYLEMVAAAGAILDRKLGGVGKGLTEQLLEANGHPTDASSRAASRGPAVGTFPAVKEFAYRPVPARALAASLFALAVLAFSLPFISVVADRRTAEATGFELATRSVTFHGTYVHESYRGETERWTRRGEVPSLIALVLLMGALALVWIPWRTGPTAGTILGLLALVTFYALTQRVGSTEAFAITDRRFGFTFAVLFTLAAAGWSTYLLVHTPLWRKPDPAGQRDYFA
jgi:hypothetical protein